MVSSIRSGDEPRPATRPVRTPPSRPGVGRPAERADALGWTLLGFILGVAAAIAVLMHADFGRPVAAESASAPSALDGVGTGMASHIPSNAPNPA